MHDQPKYRPLRAERVLRRRVERAAARRGHGRARHAAGRCRPSSPARTAPCSVTRAAVPGRRSAVLDRGAGALQHLLHALPRRAPAAATAWSCSAAIRSRRRSTAIGCGSVEAGYFFDVMTNGFGAMPDYRAQITPRDRWTIVAYIRALQLSQHAATADVPGGDPTKLAPAGGAPAAGAPAEALRHRSTMQTHAVDHRRLRRWRGCSSGRSSSASIGARWRARVGAVHEPRSVLPVVADRLPVLPRPDAGLARAADAAAPVGRPVGPGRPARLRGGARATLPLVALLFVPLLFGMPRHLRLGAARAPWPTHIIQAEGGVPEQPFFIVRALPLLRVLDGC